MAKHMVKMYSLYELFELKFSGKTSEESMQQVSFVVSSVSLSLSHWYPGSGVVLDCIDS